MLAQCAMLLQRQLSMVANMQERVSVSIESNIARVTLTRPDKFNALDQLAFDQFSAAAKSIAANRSVRVVILSAQGEHFCAGADKAFLQGAVSDKAVFSERALQTLTGESCNEFQYPAMAWMEMRAPVIAVLNGITYGAGCQIALAADFRIASPSLRLSLFEINWGLIPDMGVTQSLLRLVPLDVAKELVMTGRELNASQAKELALVTKVDDNPQKAADELAASLLQRSPDAIGNAKKLLDTCVDLNRSDALRLEAVLQADLVGSKNQLEAAMANLQKRQPNFE